MGMFSRNSVRVEWACPHCGDKQFDYISRDEARSRRTSLRWKSLMPTELTQGRNFHVYSRQMDASVDQKLQDITPHIKEGIIVDKGAGTGLLMHILQAKLPDSIILGTDVSSHYTDESDDVIQVDARDQYFPDGTVDTIIFSSVLHEVYSYSGYVTGAVKDALKVAWDELKPGGRLIIRDGVAPPHPQDVWIGFGNNHTKAVFYRFLKDFKGGLYENLINNLPTSVFQNRQYFLVSLWLANEFLSKKDYTTNWDQEMNEVFGFWTKNGFVEILTGLGFSIQYTCSYCNPWILKNRYAGKVTLRNNYQGGPSFAIQHPATTIVVVAEKPA